MQNESAPGADLSVRTLAVGALEVNCYLIGNGASGDGFVIDPGDEGDRIVKAVADAGFRPMAVLLTHAHVDHIRGVPRVASAFGIPVVLDRLDLKLYHSPANALNPWVPAARGLPETMSALPPACNWGPEILPTPGHSRGGRCFYFRDAGILFAGDTLFRGSVGRTDLPGADTQQLLHSIHETLMQLPDQTVVYPGHGPPTTIAEERHTNPFL